MTGHHESTGPDPALSSDSVHRVAQYQTAGLNARLKVSRVWSRRACRRARRTTWWPRWGPGRSLGAQREVVELHALAPASGSAVRGSQTAGTRA